MGSCRGCGQKLEAAWQACPRCGTLRDEPDAAPAAGWRRWRTKGIVAGSIGVVLGLVLLIVATHNPKPERVASLASEAPRVTERATPPPTHRPLPSVTTTAPRAATDTAVVATRPKAAPRPARAIARTPQPTLAPDAQPDQTDAPVDLCGAPSNPWGYNFCARGGYVINPPKEFCSYFSCIGTEPDYSSFWKGTGYVDQCVDGEFGKSGGRPDACSTHGGEKRALNRN